MKNIFNFKKIILLTAAFMLIFSSCTDDDGLSLADRLFRPVLNTPPVPNMTSIKLVWDKYKDASFYELEISEDTFKTVLGSYKTDSAKYTFYNLEYDSPYQIRLRSVGKTILANGDTIKSKYIIYQVRTIDYPTLLSAPTSSDVIDKSVRVKWKISSTLYTHIDVMLSKDTLFKTVLLSDLENVNGEKIIPGLQPNQSYIIKIYAGDEYKGKKTFKTANAQEFIGNVVDLRDYEDIEAKEILTQVFVDSLATLYPEGFNMILSGGTEYTLGTINIPVSLNMVTGLSFKGNAILRVNGSIGAKAGITISKLRLEKIFFDQGNVAGKLKTDGYFGGAYLINMNQANGNIDTLIVNNCVIKYKRGFLRLQTSATINQLTVSNCIMDSIGGYGIVNMDNSASLVKDMTIKNTTISHYDGYICRATKTSLIPNSITIENITSCYGPGTGKYLFELTAKTYPGGISIKNSIFGGGLTADGAVNGLRSDCSSITVDNCYKTTDLIWAIAVNAVEPTYPIDCTDLGKTSLQIFNNPVFGDYKVSDAKLVNKAGDPRWW